MLQVLYNYILNETFDSKIILTIHVSKYSKQNDTASYRITPFTTRYPGKALLGIPVHFPTLARALQT